jgi:hypothetical protein
MSDESRRKVDPVPPGAEDEELVAADDAVIGRVFRWSLLVIAGVALIVVVGLWLSRTEEPAREVLTKDVGQVSDLVQATEAMPTVEFVDITREAGIDFVHTNGAVGLKLLPESMGSGAAFFDPDGDGDPDLLLVNATHWPDSPQAAPSTMALYRNDGAGRFVDATEASGLDATLYGVGVAAGDIDNDGDPDLYVTALGENRLYRNDDGRFVDVTASAGVAGEQRDWSSSAGFFDYDNDGDLDLFVCNYVRWSKEIDLELNFTLNGRDRAYGPPTSYEGSHPYLYRNEGGGRFTDVSAEAGVRVNNPLTGRPMAKALAVVFADLDLDGFIDIFVANDTVQNFLYRNLGDGTFKEMGATAGVGFDGAGNATGAMGIDVAHHRNDHQLALAIANFANEMSSLYVSQRGGPQFTDEAAGEGVGAPSRRHLSFGLFFFDYDLDGRVDLLQANGHLEDEINQVQASQHYRQPVQLFWNGGPEARSCFAEVPPDRLGDLSRPLVGRGAAFADIDADGDQDVLLTQAGDAPVLLRNDQALGHHWLRVRLEGRRSNRDAIGAWVEVEAADLAQRRQVMPTRSYLSQVERTLTFGLGERDAVDAVRVTWPGGSVQDVGPLAVDAVHTLVEP